MPVGIYPRPSTENLFHKKIELIPFHSCWEWTASKHRLGYAEITINGKKTYAHRWSYEFYKGKIPDGLEIDHLCKNRGCVNPAHLEAVTRRENCLRSNSPMANHARQTHCIHGHELIPENIYLKSHGRRSCKICAQNRASEQRRKANEFKVN